MNRPVAFFDFDGTLTHGDTLLPFLRHLVGTPKYYLNLVLISPILGAYATKLLRNDIAKQMVLKRYLRGLNSEHLRNQGQIFSEQKIPRMQRKRGIEKLNWHQQRGHSCVLVSASLDIYLEPWAKTLGFDAVLASQLQYNAAGLATGRLVGKNCHGEEKAKRISDWLAERQPETTYAYGDTRGDYPMLRQADHAHIMKNNCFFDFTDIRER